MVEQEWLDRWNKREERMNAMMDRIMAAIEAIRQQQNCVWSSSNGAANSLDDASETDDGSDVVISTLLPFDETLPKSESLNSPEASSGNGNSTVDSVSDSVFNTDLDWCVGSDAVSDSEEHYSTPMTTVFSEQHEGDESSEACEPPPKKEAQRPQFGLDVTMEKKSPISCTRVAIARLELMHEGTLSGWWCTLEPLRPALGWKYISDVRQHYQTRPLPSPPPQPPDRSFQKTIVGFKPMWELTMPLPPPEPLDLELLPSGIMTQSKASTFSRMNFVHIDKRGSRVFLFNLSNGVPVWQENGVSVCRKCQDQMVGVLIHGQAYGSAFLTCTSEQRALLNFDSKVGNVETARQVIDEMPKMIKCVYNSHLMNYIAVGKLVVDITTFPHDSRCTPPGILFLCCSVAISGNYEVATTTYLTKSLYALLNYINTYVQNWAHPPPPPEPPDLHCCVVSTVRFCPTPVYCAFHICSCMRIAHFVYDEMLNLVVVSLNSMFWSYTTASLIVMTDLVKRNKDVNGLETNSQDSVALIRRTGDSVHIGETFANLKIIGGKYVLTGWLHTPPWSGIEDHSLLFSLYVFGKSEDFFLRMVVINIMGCISAFNYGLFCWSQCYFLCTENRKLEIHQDICDQKIFTGWIEHELLSYFPSHGSENYQTTWVQLLKKFREGKMSFVECVLCLKVSVGINLLIAAMKFYEGEYHAPHLEWNVTNKIVIGIAHVLVYRYFDVTHVLVVLKLQSSSDRDWKRRKVKPFVMSNLRGRLQQQQATQMPLNIFQDKDGLPRIVLTDPNGSSVEVLLHGGQSNSWKNQRKEELLFMSSKANWKQHKAIRGGISACFARFGDIGSLEQNGFTRNRMWSLDRDPPPLPPIENHSSVDLILKSTGVDLKIPLRFELRLRISLIYWEGTLRLEAIRKETTSTQKHLLNSNLEDKVDFNGGGNVMIRLAKTSQVSNWRISGSRISKKGGVKRGVAYIIV